MIKGLKSEISKLFSAPTGSWALDLPHGTSTFNTEPSGSSRFAIPKYYISWLRLMWPVPPHFFLIWSLHTRKDISILTALLTYSTPGTGNFLCTLWWHLRIQLICSHIGGEFLFTNKLKVSVSFKAHHGRAHSSRAHHSRTHHSSWSWGTHWRWCLTKTINIRRSIPWNVVSVITAKKDTQGQAWGQQKGCYSFWQVETERQSTRSLEIKQEQSTHTLHLRKVIMMPWRTGDQ